MDQGQQIFCDALRGFTLACPWSNGQVLQLLPRISPRYIIDFPAPKLIWIPKKLQRKLSATEFGVDCSQFTNEFLARLDREALPRHHFNRRGQMTGEFHVMRKFPQSPIERK
jgi:hypothetical protein